MVAEHLNAAPSGALCTCSVTPHLPQCRAGLFRQALGLTVSAELEAWPRSESLDSEQAVHMVEQFIRRNHITPALDRRQI
jgi:hypothetical protein